MKGLFPMLGAVALVLTSGLPSVYAVDWWPFQKEDDRLLEQVREARQRGDLNLAQALLDELSELRRSDDPDVGLERGRLSIAKGQLDMGAAVFERVAALAPLTTAREELAAAYVRLGRWPDAVSSLERALDERGSGLPADSLRADPRFAALVGFAPFDALIEASRELQAGPLGRMMLRLERLEGSARETVVALQRLTELMTLVARIATSFLLPLFSFVFLGLLSTMGAAQLSPLGRPWTLLVGFAMASVVWINGTQRLTAGASSGLNTVFLGTGVILGAWLVLKLLGWGVRAIAARLRSDPWASAQRTNTLVLLERLGHLAHAVDRGEADEAELRAASDHLKLVLSGSRKTTF